MGGRACRLDLGERAIENFDLRRLLHLLRDEYSIVVTGLYVLPEAIHQYAERELKLRLFPIDPGAPEAEAVGEALEEESDPEEEEVAEPELAIAVDAPTEPEVEEPTIQAAVPLVALPEPGRRTLYVHRTLRSGASVRFEGDIMVMGDVNPGAQVIGSGNVLVLGALKGLAHAGSAGDEGAFILAFDLRPTQLRIARKIAIPPQRTPDARFDPEVARIEGDHLVVEPYRPRSSR
ncbi:MAG: septum site-determining protein MinC [Deltaproteobacteria bacterium]|nr:septum site-determining protein MinC [Deltaproteobacteria bacterium]